MEKQQFVDVYRPCRFGDAFVAQPLIDCRGSVICGEAVSFIIQTFSVRQSLRHERSGAVAGQFHITHQSVFFITVNALLGGTPPATGMQSRSFTGLIDQGDHIRRVLLNVHDHKNRRFHQALHLPCPAHVVLLMSSSPKYYLYLPPLCLITPPSVQLTNSTAQASDRSVDMIKMHVDAKPKSQNV